MGVGWRLVWGVTAGLLVAAQPVNAAQDVDDRGSMAAFLRNDCGACHGLTLRGGLGPALTPEALAGRSAQELRAVIRDGRPGTAMPPWASQLSGAQIDELVELLLAEDANRVAATADD